MQFTERVRRMKLFFMAAAVIIAAASLIVSGVLTNDLRGEEQQKMEIWAEAMYALNNADNNTDLSLVLKIIDNNTLIPIIILSADGQPTDSRNIRINAGTSADSISYLRDVAHHLEDKGNVIRIVIDEAHPESEYIDVCYDESLMLRRLRLYPVIQLGVVLIFVIVAVFALLASKKAEQNKVWVGLAKETAHQLGTPVSSLMAWTEILKETYPDDALIPEMDSDIKRLQLIAERFSKIGSMPEHKETCVNDVVRSSVEYMKRRVPKTVTIQYNETREKVMAQMDGALMEWVVENLIRNAVDATDKGGRIIVTVGLEAKKAVIEVEDNGKGIEKKYVDAIFQPGFTTKKRGWGLGLSLAKRIVEQQHGGTIKIKRTQPGAGTIFRIQLNT